jgi:hypothetical protein
LLNIEKTKLSTCTLDSVTEFLGKFTSFTYFGEGREQRAEGKGLRARSKDTSRMASLFSSPAAKTY